VIITDWFMPEMNGIEFLRTLRANEATKDVPIIIVSGNGSKDDVARAIQLKVSGYVLKPFTAETFKERIAAICAAVAEGAHPETAEELAAMH
jgi:two-component system chemotaxis response regulator CheY